MTNVINVELAFDSEAHVWYVKRSDVQGLRIEADTVDALIARIPDALRDLLGDGDADGARVVPVKVIAHHSTSVRLEAA